MKKEILKHVLHAMNKKQVPLEMGTIQVIVYFLKETGIPLRYKYEPYGPYSSELSSELNDLAFWGELSVKHDDT